MSSFGESMAFALSDTSDCGPNFCGDEFLKPGEECDFHKPRKFNNGANHSCKNHDFNYGRYSHPVADKILVREIFSGKHFMPADYSGSGYYDFLRQLALGSAFWLKSFSSAEQVPENVTYPWEGLKNSEEEPMVKNKKGKSKNKGEKPKQKNVSAPKAVKQVIKHEKQEKKTLDNLKRNEKAMVRSLENKVSAAPMMQRLESSLKRRVENGKVIVDVVMPLGPITMSTSDKYLDIYSTIKVNPQIFKDSTVYAEAKIHEKYKVKHCLVYESSCGSNNGGVVKVIFDPDPHDEYGNSLSQGQDLQNQWAHSWSAFQEKPQRGKVVKSPLLWTNNTTDGLVNTNDVTEKRLTDAGTWVIYCRLPPTTSGVIGEFCLVAEFTFTKIANEGMFSYGIGVNSDFDCPVNGIVPTPVVDTGGTVNESLSNFFVGDQFDLNDALGTTGFQVGSSGLKTQANGSWIITFYFNIINDATAGSLSLVTENFDNVLEMAGNVFADIKDHHTYAMVYLVRKKARSSGQEVAQIGLQNLIASTHFDFFATQVSPINEETFELLFARAAWSTEPPALVKGKGNKMMLPKPKMVKPTKTERLTSKLERPSDVGSTVGPTVGGKVAVFDHDTHTVPNTGGMEDGVRSTDQFVGLTTEEIEDFLKKKRAKEQRQLAKVQEQIDSADVVRNLQRKIDRVNNQLKFAEMQPRLEFRQQVETHVKAKPEYPLAVAQVNTQS